MGDSTQGSRGGSPRGEALAFTRDGRQLAVSLGFAARVIDVATGNELRRSPKQPVGMNAVAVSPDGGTLATTGLMIKLWDIATGQEKTPSVSGHGGSVESVAFSPDGKTPGDGQLRPHRQAVGHRDSARADDAGRPCEFRSVGGVQPRWQVAGVDRVRTRVDPLGTLLPASACAPGKRSGDLGRRVRFQPGRPLGRSRNARA